MNREPERLRLSHRLHPYDLKGTPHFSGDRPQPPPILSLMSKCISILQYVGNLPAVLHKNRTSTSCCILSSLELLTEDVLESDTILGELLDTLVELVERHRVLEEVPAELRLIVNVRHLSNVLRRCCSLRIELLGDWVGRLPELLKECGSNGEEVDTGQRLDLAGLVKRGSGTECNSAITRNTSYGKKHP